MKDYPARFRLPDINYDMAVDMGVLRTPFETGYTRQRRRYVSMPTQLSAIFIVENAKRPDWFQWWAENAYTWFIMKVPNMTLVGNDAACEEKAVRCISNLNISPVGPGHTQITAIIEFHPNWAADVYEKIGIAGGGGGDCDFDWVIAGTPDVPSSDEVIAGTPDAPSA